MAVLIFTGANQFKEKRHIPYFGYMANYSINLKKDVINSSTSLLKSSSTFSLPSNSWWRHRFSEKQKKNLSELGKVLFLGQVRGCQSTEEGEDAET